MPARRTKGCDGEECSRCLWRDAVYEPGWRSRGRCAELGRERQTCVVDSSRPALRGPALCHSRDGRRIGDLVRPPFHHEIELVGRDAQRAARVAGEILRFAGPSPVSNQNASSTQRAPMPVTCGLPSRLIVANQHVCRFGPPVSGAWLRPRSRRSLMRPQSRSGVRYRSARLVASMVFGRYSDGKAIGDRCGSILVAMTRRAVTARPARRSRAIRDARRERSEPRLSAPRRLITNRRRK